MHTELATTQRDRLSFITIAKNDNKTLSRDDERIAGFYGRNALYVVLTKRELSGNT